MSSTEGNSSVFAGRLLEAADRSQVVPEELVFQTKTEMALDQIERLLADGVPKAPIVMDAFYGRATPIQGRGRQAFERTPSRTRR